MNMGDAPKDDGGEKRISLPKAFACAFSGIGHAFAEGRNFKIECVFAVAAIVLGLAFGIDATSWLVVIVCIGLVLGAECANTALEALVDLVSPEYNDFARIAKDCAAGAVLILSIAALIVGIALYAPPILNLIGLMP